jgi:hypothetical protein
MQVYNWNQSGFEQAYSRSIYKPRGCGVAKIHSCKCSEKDITYSRDFFETNSLFAERAENIIQAINLPENSTVLVVGCALGFLMVELGARGMRPVGIDNSSYIQSMKNRHYEKINYPIYDISITDENFISKLDRQANISQFDCIITEDVLPSYDDWELILDNCESALQSSKSYTNIVHIVNDDHNQAPFVSKTVIEWQQVRNTHTWLDGNGFSI